ncbi:MAG: CRISPR-associated protein Cas4 [Thermoproteus sp.]
MYITPTDVKDYLFCPAVIALRRIGVAEPPAERLANRRGLPPGVAARFVEVRAEVPLERRPFRGVADYVAVDRWGLVVPVEVKSSSGPPTASEIYQLAAYMYMAEALGPVKYGLLVKDAVHEVAYTEALAESLLRIAGEIARMYEGGDPPYVSGRCAVCGYARLCPYR